MKGRPDSISAHASAAIDVIGADTILNHLSHGSHGNDSLAPIRRRHGRKPSPNILGPMVMPLIIIGVI